MSRLPQRRPNRVLQVKATVVIKAGPPAAVALNAAPMTVASFGSAKITAMVTDSNGNGVGGLSLTATTSGDGTVTAFAADATTFGTYTATYTAPMVAAKGTEMVTVSTDGVSETLTLNLTPEPPKEVSILALDGVVYKADGEVPADGVDVTVTVGSNPAQTVQTDANGTFSVTVVNLGGVAARTGDLVSIVVMDATGERGKKEFPLTSAQLGDDDSATVTVPDGITTDIVIPPRSVNILVVEGVVKKDDGMTPAGIGLNVTVTVGSNPAQTVQTDSDGAFSATIVNLSGMAASTGDPVSIVVMDATAERGSAEFNLSNIQLGEGDSATVTQDVNTDLGSTSKLLALFGTVYLKNGDTQKVPASSDLRGGDLTVTVTNANRNVSMSGTVDKSGEYAITFFTPTAIVAETGDALTIEVQNESGESVGTMSHTLTTAEVEAARVDLNIETTAPAEVRILDIVGSITEMDGSPVSGIDVTLELTMNGTVRQTKVVTTGADGSYRHTFVNLAAPVAATGDMLTVDVLRASDQFIGHRTIELRSYQLVYLNQPLEILPILLIPPRLELGGLSIDTRYTGIQDSIIQEFLNMDLMGLAVAAGALAGDDAGNPLVALPPSLPLLISPILAAIGVFQIELPAGFDPTNEYIAKESFGNAITTRPTAWAALAADSRLPGRWVTGDHLNLYISGAPTIESVTFSLNGMPMAATSVPAGGTFPYTFQLEEELVGLFSGELPAFTSVELRIDGQGSFPMAPNSMGVWSVDVDLSPGSTVAYYYWVELSQPYHDLGLAVKAFAHLDPRNRQLITDGLSETLEGLLESELSELVGVRSVFTVPEVNEAAITLGRYAQS